MPYFSDTWVFKRESDSRASRNCKVVVVVVLVRISKFQVYSKICSFLHIFQILDIYDNFVYNFHRDYYY